MRKKFPITNYPACAEASAGRQLPITNYGFTIIELLVSMGVFVVLLGIIVTIFINSLRSQQAMVALMATNDNASLTLEQMSRELRTGTKFFIPTGPTPPLPCDSAFIPPAVPDFGDTLAFCNANNKNVIYRFNTVPGATFQTIERRVDPNPFTPITGANVRVTNLRFELVHLGLSGIWPPRLTITLEVGSKHPRLQEVKTRIQTTISARNI